MDILELEKALDEEGIGDPALVAQLDAEIPNFREEILLDDDETAPAAPPRGATHA